MKKLLTLLTLFTIGILIFWQNEKVSEYIFDTSERAKEFRDKLNNPQKYFRTNYIQYLPNIYYTEENPMGVKERYFNQAGYRGEVIPLKKTNKLRVLFLGGSTTLISPPGKTILSSFPTQLKTSLAKKLNISQDNIEIINAGIDGAVSPTLLILYLYKYKYYQADYLIIHTGFNDCGYYTDSIYYPDYTHLDFDFVVEPEINWFKKDILNVLLTFRFSSWIVYRYATHSQSRRLLYTKKKRKDYPKWKQLDSDSAISNYKYNAFYNNIKTLTQNAHLNNTKVILVQMPYNTEHKFNKDLYARGIKTHNYFLEKISLEFNVPIVSLEEMNITNEHFYDPVHVDSLGNVLKGEAVAKTLYESIMDNSDNLRE